MIDQQIFDEIEDGQVLVDLRLASGWRALDSRMSRNVILREALCRMKDDAFRVQALEHAENIASLPEMPGFAHPLRTALAAYAYLFFNTSFIGGRRFILRAATTNRQDWLEVTALLRHYSESPSEYSAQDAPQTNKGLSPMSTHGLKPNAIADASVQAAAFNSFTLVCAAVTVDKRPFKIAV